MQYLNKTEIDSAIEFTAKSSATLAEQIQQILVSTLKHASEHGDCSHYVRLIESLIENHPGKRLPHSVRPIIAWIQSNAIICEVINDKPKEFKIKMVRNWRRKASGIDWELTEANLWLDSTAKRARAKPDLSGLTKRALTATRAAIDESLIERTPEAIHSFLTKVENDLLRELGLFAESAEEIEAEAEKTAEIKEQINVDNNDLRELGLFAESAEEIEAEAEKTADLREAA